VSSPPEVPAALLERFEELLDEVPRGERRQLDGRPWCFVGSVPFMGVLGDHLVLRLSETDQRRMASRGPVLEAPPGPAGHVVVPPELLADDAAMSAWIARAYAFALALPAEPTNPPSS